MKLILTREVAGLGLAGVGNLEREGIKTWMMIRRVQQAPDV